MRVFNTMASRDGDSKKLHIRRFFSPAVLKRRAEYMDKHRTTAKGIREPDNWKLGIPVEVYADSLVRHVLDVQLWLDKEAPLYPDNIEEKLCAVLFNAEGILFELLKRKRDGSVSDRRQNRRRTPRKPCRVRRMIRSKQRKASHSR